MMISLVTPDFLRAQIPLDSLFLKPWRSLDDIPKGCTDIETDEEGNLFLLQTGKHRLYKYFANADYDSVLTVGGKGNGQEGFNFPVKIVMPNRQSLYVLDAQNRRIVLLNTNLKVTRSFEFLSLQSDLFEQQDISLWPISFTAGPTGELYLLNQEDIKIYKFDLDGHYRLAFGGVDYGGGALISPDGLAANRENFIFAADSTEQRVSIFDLYGIFQYSLQLKTPFRWAGVTTFENHLLLYDGHNLYFKNLLTKQEKHIPLDPALGKLVDVSVTQEVFYLLFENAVHLYPLVRNMDKHR